MRDGAGSRTGDFDCHKVEETNGKLVAPSELRAPSVLARFRTKIFDLLPFLLGGDQHGWKVGA